MPEEIDPGGTEGNDQRLSKADIEKLVAEAAEGAADKVRTELQAQLDGMNRAVSAKDKEIEELKAADNAREKTDKEVMAQLRIDLDTSTRERATEKQAAEQDVKESYWSAEAVKLGLKGDVYVKSSLSKEDGLEYLKARAGFNDESIKADVNKLVASGKQPGSGNVGDAGAGEPDRTNWTDDQFVAEAEAEMQADLKKARGE